MFEDSISPDIKIQHDKSIGGANSNFDLSSIGSSSNPKLNGLNGLKIGSTQLGLHKSLKLNLKMVDDKDGNRRRSNKTTKFVSKSPIKSGSRERSLNG